MSERGASSAVEPHRHSWVEGADRRSVCEFCGSAYSPINDLSTARSEVADLRRRIERTVEYVNVVRLHIHDSNARDALGAILAGLTTSVASGDSGGASS